MKISAPVNPNYKPPSRPTTVKPGTSPGHTGDIRSIRRTPPPTPVVNTPAVAPLPPRFTALANSVANSARTGMKSGGKVSSASKRADGIAQKGKTKGRMY